MLQGANTDLLNPLVPKAQNSKCQNLQFSLQIKPVKVGESQMADFSFLNPRHYPAAALQGLTASWVGMMAFYGAVREKQKEAEKEMGQQDKQAMSKRVAKYRTGTLQHFARRDWISFFT